MPTSKYRRAILEGRGNCSNLSFGMAYGLEKMHRDFRVVIFLMTPLTRFAPDGHIVLQTSVDLGGRTEKGILDLGERGVAFKDDRSARLRDIRDGGVKGISISRLAPYRPEGPTFYERVPGKVLVGVITAGDCRKYYDFLSSVYFPLGNGKLEKYLYEAIALVAGRYPPVYIKTEEAHALDRGDSFWRMASVAFLWYLRVVLITAAAAATWMAARALNSRLRKSRLRAILAFAVPRGIWP